MVFKDECNNQLMSALQKGLQITKEYLYNESKKNEMVHLKYEEMNALTSFPQMSMQNNAMHMGELNWVTELIVYIEHCILNLLSEAEEDIEENRNLDDELVTMLKNELTKQMELCFNNPLYVKALYIEIKKLSGEIRKIEKEIQDLRRIRAIVKKK